MTTPSIRLTKRRQAFLEGEGRRAELIRLVQGGKEIPDACEAIGVSISAYRKWRDRYPEWRRDLELARRQRTQAKRWYDGSFVSFREVYLGMQTTWFQQKIVDAIEKARPGEVTLVLIPPEHGKTTLLEDWCTYKLCTDPSFRITVASETVDHGIKIIERVRHRLEPDGPSPLIPKDFGPLAPEPGTGRNQVWGMRQFDVAQRVASDERDYSMHAVGVKGRVQGTRCDLLLLDDIQDVKSLDQTETYFNIITQSFLSRPSMFGRTVIIGTRVGEFDIYRRLLDAEIEDHLVKIPAYADWDGPEWPRPSEKPHPDRPETWAPEGLKFLWPDKYDGEDGPGFHRFRYAALRYRVGEVAWARNYMQKPEAASTMTFDEATTDQMKDEQRSIIGDPVPRGENDPVPVVIALDPSIGGVNAVLAAAMYPDRMDVLSIRRDEGLSKFSEIFDVVEEECHRWSTLTSFVSTLVIEDKAFQRGLLRDDRLIEMERRFGFRVVPNTTGREKNDPTIGVGAMPVGMVRGEITIPWADEPSRKNMYWLLRDLHIWRPGTRGNTTVVKSDKVPQDHTMTLWFAWRVWRGIRHTPVHKQPDSASWQMRSSPLRKPRPRKPVPHTTYRRLGTIPRRTR